MEWEAGSASGGSNGQGGTAPRIGFSNAVNTFFELSPYSGVNGPAGAKGVSSGTNVGIPGMFLFQVSTGNAADLCPLDPLKTLPGNCGCNAPETTPCGAQVFPPLNLLGNE
jgi:hypothetical protein